MKNPRPRLERDVVELAERSAENNGRSLPAEINFALRHYYLRQAGVIPKDMQLDPNPFRVETIKRRKRRKLLIA